MNKMTLKAARVNAGLTQAEASKKLGVTQSTLRRWETGSDMKLSQFMSLCRLYNVTCDSLFLENKLAKS